MKVFRVAAAAAIGAFAILGQGQTRPASPATSTQTRFTAGPANIAVINSAAFTEDSGGIARLMSAVRQIEAKFQPVRTELRGMRDRLGTMRADIQKKSAIQDPRITRQQTDDAERLELEIKRKTEDAQANYQRDSIAALEPLQKDIADSLRTYAQSKGISLLIDVSRVPVIYSASNLDVTRDFIAEYNRTHPVTGTRP